MNVRNLVAAAVVTAGLVLTGCSASTLPGFSSPAANTSTVGGEGFGTGTGSGSGSGAGSDSNSGTGSAGGFTMNADCLSVASAFSTIALQLVPSALSGGTGTFDATKLAQTLSSLGGSVPAELKPNFDALSKAASEASGKSMADAGAILNAPWVQQATDNISAWMDKNCGT